MKWEKPNFNDIRLGFEVTCYIAINPFNIRGENKLSSFSYYIL